MPEKSLRKPGEGSGTKDQVYLEGLKACGSPLKKPQYSYSPQNEKFPSMHRAQASVFGNG